MNYKSKHNSTQNNTIMTNNEFKKKIADSIHTEWAKSVIVDFDFSYVNASQKITGLSAIYEYVNQQLDGWNGMKDSELPEELKRSKEYFGKIRQKLIEFVASFPTDFNINYTWRNGIENFFKTTNKFILPYNIPEVPFLIRIYQLNSNYFNGAFNCIIRKSSIDTTNKDSFFGALLAYEFIQKDQSDIVERRNAEKASMSRIRNDFQQYLSESENILVGHLKDTNDKYDEYVKRIDELKNEKDTAFNTWFKDTNTSFNTWFENTKATTWQKWYDSALKNIGELEKTYREKLKLEEPAKYWSERSVKLKRQGWIALVLILALVVMTCLSLGVILWQAPEQIYASWFGNDKSAAIRWTIIYVTLISFIAYAIRAITKFMFSSFHLARDCEERYTLTYFYLSLLKDSKIDEKDRQLIMQSLFSRAETGLLKDDSSPTMPSDAISTIVSK